MISVDINIFIIARLYSIRDVTIHVTADHDTLAGFILDHCSSLCFLTFFEPSGSNFNLMKK